MQRRLVLAAAVSAGSLVLGTPALAAAAPATRPKAVVVASGVFAPFQMVYRNGTLLIADGGQDGVFSLTGKTLAPVVAGPKGGTVEAVAVNAKGEIAYTNATGQQANRLTIVGGAHGPVTTSLLAFEKKHNPDASVRYGFDHPSACVKASFKKLKSGPASYTGVVDSHAYSVAALPGGSWVVGDAAGNDLVKVGATGKASLLALLPPQPHVVTAKDAKKLGLAGCVVGKTFDFEPVPTDVQVGPGGALYVTTLPGGPEGTVLGPRGSVYRVSADGSKVSRIATGFAGATNLAISARGVVYVAELFSGKIARVSHGRPVLVATLPNVVSLAWGKGALYAGTLAPGLLTGKPTGPGTIVKITL